MARSNKERRRHKKEPSFADKMREIRKLSEGWIDWTEEELVELANESWMEEEP